MTMVTGKFLCRTWNALHHPNKSSQNRNAEPYWKDKDSPRDRRALLLTRDRGWVFSREFGVGRR
jgi:hypothetical protein